MAQDSDEKSLDSDEKSLELKRIMISAPFYPANPMRGDQADSYKEAQKQARKCVTYQSVTWKSQVQGL